MLSILLGILLGILKFILFLIGLILIIIALILFVPIKYNIIANSGDLFAKNKIFNVDINCSWLLKILKLKINFKNDGKSVKFFIFGIELFKKKPKKQKNKQKPQPEKQEPNKETKQEEKDKQYEKQEPKQEPKQEKQSTTSEKNNINNKKEKKSKTKKSEPKKSNAKKSSKFEDLKAKFDKYYNHPDKDLVITKTKELIIKLLKAIAPDKAKLDVELGLDDPFKLGQIVGYSAAFCGILNKELFLHGNFDEKILKIDIFIRGKLIIWKLTYPLIQYAFVKPIFNIIKNKLKRR